VIFVRGGVSQHVALRADPFLPLSVGVVDYAEYGEPFKLLYIHFLVLVRV
jgi:hypothetical protein